MNVNKWPSPLTVKAVSEKANEVRKDWNTDAEEFTPKRTGGLVRSLGFETNRTNAGFRFTVTKPKLAELVTPYPPKLAPAGGP